MSDILDEMIVKAMEDDELKPVVPLEKLEDILREEATGLINAVETFKRHPSYDSRKALRDRSNQLTGMYVMLIRANNYQRTPNGDEIRTEVARAQIAVKKLYDKQKKNK